MQKNERVSVSITGMSAEGHGVGRLPDGMTVFVPLTVTGDNAEIVLTKVTKNYAFGKALSINFPSPHRIEPDCECFGKCGGCAYRHIDYEFEKSIKTQKIADALLRIGGFDVKLSSIIGAECIDRYRNKAQLPVSPGANGPQIGFYAARSHRIVNTDRCPLSPEVFESITLTVRRWMTENGVSAYDEAAHTGTVRHIYIRQGVNTGEIMVCLIVNSDSVRCAEQLAERLRENKNIHSVMLNINKTKGNVIAGKKCVTLYGSVTISDTLSGLHFDISPLSFYQVNPRQAERLYEKAAEYAGLTGSETVLDLYCGAGTIGLTMASKSKRIIGVEIVPEAVGDAKNNALKNGITNAEFIASDAKTAARMIEKQGIKPDVIIVDPPRKGCEPEVIEAMLDILPERIVYVSCDPATLARDLKALCESSYELRKVTPVDMFPRTSHVETITLLQRCDT